jgi:hypothetical protein
MKPTMSTKSQRFVSVDDSPPLPRLTFTTPAVTNAIRMLPPISPTTMRSTASIMFDTR